MKKQFLILSFFVLALFAGTMTAFAQPTLTPTPLDNGCIDLTNPLTPVPGNPYTYEVDVPAPVGTKTFHWFVTQDEDFINAGNLNLSNVEAFGGSILATGSANYNTVADADTVSLTWQSFSLAATEYVFVVVYVENTDDCTTNNLKVYRITPLHAFTLDLAVVNKLTDLIWTDTDNLAQCVDDVQSAVYDAAQDGVVYDFGSDTLYYAVAAANFSEGYQLSAQFTGLQAATANGTTGQEATIYWASTLAGLATTTNSTAIADNTPTVLGVIDVQDASGTVGQDGEMLYIMVVIEHHSFEAANDAESYTYTLAIDGILVDDTGTSKGVGFEDLHYANCTADGYTNDVADQDLTARPTVDPVSPTPFLPIEE